MKIEAFSTLNAVLRKGTMAAAAETLHVTPSAVSMQLKQIEQYFGQQLFDRSGLQAKPTPLAYEISETMQQALSKIEALRKRPTMAIEGNIRLGVIDSMQPILLPGTMRLLRERYPNLHIQPTRGKSAALTDAVKAGKIDAAVVAQPENGGSARLIWNQVMRRTLILIAPPSAEETSITTLFRKYEWIRYDRSTITGRMAARYINEQVREKRGPLELDSVRAIVAMVSAGLGISVIQLSEPSICLTYPVKVLPLGRGAPVVQFSLVTRKSDSDSRPLFALKEAMMTVAEGGHEQASF